MALRSGTGCNFCSMPSSYVLWVDVHRGAAVMPSTSTRLPHLYSGVPSPRPFCASRTHEVGYTSNHALAARVIREQAKQVFVLEQ